MSTTVFHGTKQKRIFLGVGIVFILLAALGFRIYGSSTVTKADVAQALKITSNKETSEIKKHLEKIISEGSRYNIFVQTEGELKLVKKKLKKGKPLSDIKINLKAGSTKGSDIGSEIRIDQNGSSQKLIINCDALTPSKLVNEDSWSGSFYRMTFGYSLPSTIRDISNWLQEFKKENGNNECCLGISLLKDEEQFFIYNINENEIVAELPDYVHDDTIKSLDIICYFIDLETLRAATEDTTNGRDLDDDRNENGSSRETPDDNSDGETAQERSENNEDKKENTKLSADTTQSSTAGAAASSRESSSATSTS